MELDDLHLILIMFSTIVGSILLISLTRGSIVLTGINYKNETVLTPRLCISEILENPELKELRENQKFRFLICFINEVNIENKTFTCYCWLRPKLLWTRPYFP